MKTKLIILGLAALVFGGLGVYSEYFKDTTLKIVPNKDFVSPEFGIAFDYKPDPLDQNSKTKILEQGNVVYIYDESISKKPQDGQFVEVFFKDKAESLKDAIIRIVMPNSPSNCEVSIFESDGHDRASISYENPTPEEDTLIKEDWFYWIKLTSDRCTAEYGSSNGLSYFAYYPEYPDRFFFFSIGQYGIATYNNKLWQDTFEVFSLK